MSGRKQYDLSTPEGARTALIAFGDEFFDDVHSREQLFNLLRTSFQSMSDLYKSLGKREALTFKEAAQFQLASCTVAAMIDTLEHSPVYDSPALEGQLKYHLRKNVRESPVVKFNVSPREK